MTDIDRLSQALKNAHTKAQAGDAQAERHARQIAAEIRRLQGSQRQPSGFQRGMSQLNAGITDAVGGLVDFVNPFDKPHSLNPFPGGTGSAKDGLQRAGRAIGTDFATEEPQTTGEAFMRGAGQSAGALIPVAQGLQALRGAGGAVGAFADDALTALGSVTGVGAEVLAGGVSGAAEQAAEDAGAPEWAQSAAAVAAPMAVLPAAGAAVRGGQAVAKRTPGVRAATGAVQATRATLAPFTKAGAEDVARNRLRDLAGGARRAEELSELITPDNPLNLTPAQQTGDDRMIGLEQLARDLDPALDAHLRSQSEASRQMAGQDIRVDGDFSDTRQFFDSRRREYKASLQELADNAVKEAGGQVSAIEPGLTNSENSVQVSNRLRDALDSAKAEEERLWAAVPRGSQVTTSQTLATARRLDGETPKAQKNDIPRVVRELLLDQGAFGEAETVAEMHGLYSELRRVARSAVAGNDKNNNLARIANTVAEAVLEDLGAVDGATAIGQKINEARAYSAALHETFDQGAVGRLMKKTLDGDTAIDPEMALKRTVGRGAEESMTASRQIETAAPTSRPFVQDYIKGMFTDAARGPNGEFTQASAKRFISRNRELLDRYPQLRDDITSAVANQDSADEFATRVAGRIKALDDSRRSAGAALLDGSAEDALKAITGAKNPTRAARLLANEARKDPSGEALAGLKAVLSDHLISKSKLKGDGLEQAMKDPKLKSALNALYTEEERSRLRMIARELSKLDRSATAQNNVGTSLSDARTPKFLEGAIRIFAVNQMPAGRGQGAGASLQTANIVSNRARDIAQGLTADKASQLIADAITDPALFRSLLADGSTRFQRKQMSLLLPYLIGSGTAAMVEE